MDAIVSAIVNFFNNVIPKELTIFIISMLPILELRGGMLAAALLNVDRLQAFLICLFGTLLPIPFILLFLKQILKWLSNTRFVKLVHRLAHSRLGNAEYFRSRRDSSASAYVIKHLIIFEIDFSMFIHLQPPCFLSFGLLQCI